MTECKSEQFEFQGLKQRRVVAAFDGGNVTSDAGALFLREAATGSGIIDRFAACFTDHRNPDLIEYTVRELLGQRVFGLCLGYEDLNDHDQLRNDPLFCALMERIGAEGSSGAAGKSTLNRLELAREDAGPSNRYKKIVYDKAKVEDVFPEFFMASQDKAPNEIVLDLDATDIPLHGNQEGKYFHGYYDNYCFLPLYIFAGHDLLAARLRTSDCDPAEGVIEEVSRLVAKLRAKWPNVRIIVRGDSGFCRDDLMVWCESSRVDYVLGLAKNARLEAMIKKQMKRAKRKFKKTGKTARIFRNLSYRTLKTWSKKRRVVAKAEHLPEGANPRFVVTTISKAEIPAKELYEEQYCARGEMENRIKEQQMGLFADRTSAHTLRANQLRLWLSCIAYVLMNEIRRVGLRKTKFENAQCWTIREKLFKIGAVVTISVRRLVVAMSSGYPWKDVFACCLENLRHHYSTA
ncbi:MAG: IS1380 family transposase [Bdellovibrionaceae bacterium]|nr:IS1380 family transposase [Pseudobdellovibrionaceae bacterium]